MRKLFIVPFCVLVLFFIEFFIANIFDPKLTPHFLLILVIFFELIWGIRYGLYTAVLAGMLKDSFAINIFGVNIVSFIFCAYMTTVLKKHIYQRGSPLLRIVLVSAITIIYVGSSTVIYSLFVPVKLNEVVYYILWPGVWTTSIVTPFIFQGLRKCVSKFSV